MANTAIEYTTRKSQAQRSGHRVGAETLYNWRREYLADGAAGLLDLHAFRKYQPDPAFDEAVGRQIGRANGLPRCLVTASCRFVTESMSHYSSCDSYSGDPIFFLART